MTKNLLTVRQFAEKHQAFSQGSLRRIIFDRSRNGFDPVIQRFKRRILIDEAAFFLWLNEQQGG